MSWMSQLYATYEQNVREAGQRETELAPIAHMKKSAQIEVTLNRAGEFLSAVKVDKEYADTLIPVTEASAGRVSGAAPHALADMLPYVAGDYANFCENENDRKKADKKFALYIESLGEWCGSAHSHPKAEAVLAYLSRRTLTRDLIGAGIVELNEQGAFEKRKIAGQSYEKALVRFRVIGAGEEDRTWADRTLIQAFTSYYLENQSGGTDICYLLGEERTISDNHPKGIVAANYGAKLISANDRYGYTYRGRFQNAGQVCALSYEASQKIHAALKWLIETQGVYVGTSDKEKTSVRIFLCWNPGGKKVPDIFSELGLEFDEADGRPDSYRRKLIKTFQGYSGQFDREDKIVVMALEAATIGRLSITYYNELAADDFLDRVEYWSRTCRWYYRRLDGKEQYCYQIKTPLFKEIAECAFGRERKDSKETGKRAFGGENKDPIKLDDRVLKEQVQRLLKCVLDRQPVPADIVQALAERASAPLAYENRENRERVLSTACALTAKYISDREQRKGETEDMKLEEENRDRSYLFGRLLAVCEKVERAAYSKEEKERDTNAIRLQNAYANHPLQTFRILHEQLTPYFQKLSAASREYYKNLIGDIIGLLGDGDEQTLNQSLKANYLLGYYLQRAELNRGKNAQKEEEENGYLTEQN